MRIASRENVPGRVHVAAGVACTFNPEPGTDFPMVCVVTSEAAIAVLLHERNANLFYALDAPAVVLTRPSNPVAPPLAEPLASVSLTLLDQPARDVIDAIASLGVEDLAALRKAEREGKARKTVVHAIDEQIAQRAGDVASSQARDQAALVLNNDGDVVEQLLGSIADRAILAEALALEQASVNRANVVAKLQSMLG